MLPKYVKAKTQMLILQKTGKKGLEHTFITNVKIKPQSYNKYRSYIKNNYNNKLMTFLSINEDD